jgi:hypothetical protein
MNRRSIVRSPASPARPLKAWTPLLALIAASSLAACAPSAPDTSPDLAAGQGDPTPAVHDAPTPVPIPVGIDPQGDIPLLPTPTPPPQEVVTPVPPTPAPPVAVEVDEQGAIELEPTPPPYVSYRGRRRMDIDQLSLAIRTVTNGISWTQVSGSREVDLFDSLSATLGKPDYIQSTQEDLTASLIFEKFLADAANNVCRKLVQRELEQSPAERVLMVYVDPEDTIDTDPIGVEDNLHYLLRRYHTRNIDPASPEFEPWSWLFESATFVTGDPAVGWQSVCVALITHPDFFTY